MQLGNSLWLGVLLGACAAPEHTPPPAPAGAPAPQIATPRALEPDLRPRVVYERQSSFSKILVVDEGPYRFLRFDGMDGDDQAMILKDHPGSAVMPYVRDAGLALALLPSASKLRVLMIGLGGGMFTSMLVSHLDDLEVDAVEIDPAVVDVATAWFGVTPTERFRIHVADGGDFVADTKERWDLIFVDAYSGNGIPGHLATPEFFCALSDRLTGRGLVVLNLSVERDVEAQILDAFSGCQPAPPSCVETEDESNLIVFGAPKGDPSDYVHRRVQALDQEKKLGFSLASTLERWRPKCKAD